jgi:D-sedoheptulose 7-phosphate isomerase
MYLEKFKKILLLTMINEKSYSESLHAVVEFFIKGKKNKAMCYFIGNGGSAGIAVHMTADYLKNGGIKTRSMHDPSTITCLGNDFGYEYIFSKQLEIIAEKNDLLVAISSSGNSQNILNAVEVAKKKGCKIITFTGFKEDNNLRQLGDYNVYVPSMEYGIVESIHNMILQQIVDEIVDKDGVGLK